MFKITSTHPLKWPQHNFKLKTGENTFPSKNKIPEKIWPKLQRFAKSGVVSYEGSKVAEPAKAAETDTPAGPELTEAGLAKLDLKQLRAVAATLDVDVSAFKSKADTAAAILEAVNAAAEEGDEDEDSEDDEDAETDTPAG